MITAGFLAEMITGRQCDRRRRALPAMTLILMTAVIAVVAAQERIVGGRPQCAYCEVSLDTLGKKFKDPEKRLIGFRVLRYDV